MAIQDILNSQIGAQYMLNPQSDYDPTQSNVMGDSLSPTTPDNGASISVDSANDDRSALDYKMQAQLLKHDTAPLYEDDENTFVSDGGNRYDKISNTRVDQMVNAAAAFAANYLATGNAGKAALMAGQAVNDMDAKEKRYNMINELEQKNYASIDIRKWVETGDDKDLLVNKGKFVNVMPGVMMNNLTGEVKNFNVAGANMPNAGYQMGLQTINGVDYMGAPNAKGQIEIKPATKEQREMYGTQAASGGSIGLDEDEDNQNSGFVLENGQWVQHTTYANGRPKTVVANAAQQKALNAREAAKTPDAQSTQMNSDLSLLSNAVDNGKVGTFTGQLVGRLPDSAQDVYNSVNGDATERAAYQAANRIEGNMQNMGIAAATNMGASGINTEAEAERYFKSMPRLDKSSAEALKASVQAIQTYTNNYNAAKAEAAGVATPQPQQQQKPAAPAGNAPAGAIQALQANPQLAAQFKAKYGYLPEGF